MTLAYYIRVNVNDLAIDVDSVANPVAASGIDHGDLTGLSDDDHPQYVLHTDIGTNGILARTSSENYTGRTISGATGLTVTNGDGVSGNPTIDYDINSLTADASPVGSTDYVVSYDASAGTHKKVLMEDLPGGGGGGGLDSVVDDASPQLGGDLDTNSFHIRFDHAHGILDDSGDAQLIFNALASNPVNYLRIGNAATGNGPYITSSGSDTDVDLRLITQNSGEIDLESTTNVTGNITVTGTVDGRDVATAGTKLDTIETNADVTDEANVTDALDGATLTDLGTPASGDLILLQDASDSNNLKVAQFSEFSGGGGGGLSDIVDDTSPQLGGDLDTNSFNIQFDNAHGIQDDSGNPQLIFAKLPSAVNYIQISNAATTAAPSIISVGTDTNVDLRLSTKGSGTIELEDATNVTGALDVTGAITVGSTVDGRDLATDGTKLDTIETNADVTDAANVTAAGALMDSECADVAAVKALESADLTKLDGIEASADVTDEANVLSALNGATISAAAIASGDKILLQDVSDSDNLKVETFGDLEAALSITESQISDLGSYITDSSTDTLTNKTINTASNTITIVEADISDLGSYITASSSDTLTNKTFDANGTGNSISNIETADIASGSKTGADADLVTGTAGTSGNLGQWNGDGDLVDSSLATSNVMTLNTAQEYTSTKNFNMTTLTSTSNSVAWNLATNQVAKHTMTENTTLAAPTNQVAGATYMLIVVQDSTTRTMSFNSAYKFPGGQLLLSQLVVEM